MQQTAPLFDDLTVPCQTRLPHREAGPAMSARLANFDQKRSSIDASILPLVGKLLSPLRTYVSVHKDVLRREIPGEEYGRSPDQQPASNHTCGPISGAAAALDRQA